LWNHLFSRAEGDGVVDVAQVGLEAGGDVDSAEASLEVRDFKGAAGELLSELLLPGSTFVEFLTGVESAAVDGCDEPVCDSMDGLIDIQVCAEEHLSGSR